MSNRTAPHPHSTAPHSTATADLTPPQPRGARERPSLARGGALTRERASTRREAGRASQHEMNARRVGTVGTDDLTHATESDPKMNHVLVRVLFR